MRILFVEDNADFAGTFERVLSQISDLEIVWAKSRDSALRALDQQTFSLVILDRRIPTSDETLDDHTDHGWRVFQHVREQLAGTPVWFLTGTEDADFAIQLHNDYGRTGDLHGTNTQSQMCMVFWKKRISECARRLREFATEQGTLSRIAILKPDGTDLRPEEIAVLRIFARRYGGANVRLSPLNGGLSRSRVLKVIVNDAYGAPLITAAAKVASLSDIEDEQVRFATYISRLPPGAYPAIAQSVAVGAGAFGGLFYQMVGANVESVFDRLSGGRPGLASVPGLLRQIQGPWQAAANPEPVSVGRLRRKLLSDTAIPRIRAELQDIDISAVEVIQVPASQCCQHGDMHGANVVFTDGNQPMLIDFGDCGPSFAVIDPITLELSTIFHSQRIRLPGGWPTAQAMRAWSDVDRYCDGCQFASFIRECRAWAVAVAGSEAAVVAAAYAYGMRQLKYPDTDKELARELIRGCIDYLAR
jgi:CheY-like chemotaxis protein